MQRAHMGELSVNRGGIGELDSAVSTDPGVG